MVILNKLSKIILIINKLRLVYIVIDPIGKMGIYLHFNLIYIIKSIAISW